MIVVKREAWSKHGGTTTERSVVNLRPPYSSLGTLSEVMAEYAYTLRWSVTYTVDDMGRPGFVADNQQSYYGVGLFHKVVED